LGEPVVRRASSKGGFPADAMVYDGCPRDGADQRKKIPIETGLDVEQRMIPRGERIPRRSDIKRVD
jgi:hypothetical protein